MLLDQIAQINSLPLRVLSVAHPDNADARHTLARRPRRTPCHTNSTLWQIVKPQSSETGHSAQKPVECMKRPIENSSRPGEAVYDPFVGSGTTIIAAEMSARRCLCAEIDPGYCDVAIARWQAFTRETARLEDRKAFGDRAK